MAQTRDQPPTPRANDPHAVLDAIRRQLLEKIQERYAVDADEAERRLRALEEEN